MICTSWKIDAFEHSSRWISYYKLGRGFRELHTVNQALSPTCPSRRRATELWYDMIQNSMCARAWWIACNSTNPAAALSSAISSCPSAHCAMYSPRSQILLNHNRTRACGSSTGRGVSGIVWRYSRTLTSGAPKKPSNVSCTDVNQDTKLS